MGWGDTRYGSYDEPGFSEYWFVITAVCLFGTAVYTQVPSVSPGPTHTDTHALPSSLCRHQALCYPKIHSASSRLSPKSNLNREALCYPKTCLEVWGEILCHGRPSD